MERALSDEEKLRRAIEISQRRNENYYNVLNTKTDVKEKKDFKLFKKMILQIIVCMLIYMIFYLITTKNYIFSEGVINKTKEILNYDINISQIYTNCMEFINSKVNTYKSGIGQLNDEDTEEKNENEEISKENTQNNDNIVEVNEISAQENLNVDELVIEDKKEETMIVEKTQMEKDAEEVKKICKFQKPLSGKITSEFGEREILSDVMSSDHKGIDIAANLGTSIQAAMSGTVIVAEQNSEYGKFIKIQKDDVMTVYAHCNSLKVKSGDNVNMGQTIATVGTTGKSTGPHLHFEIRLSDRYINPRMVIEF